MALAAGTRLGPYEIVTPLGAGGMGEAIARAMKLFTETSRSKSCRSGLAPMLTGSRDSSAKRRSSPRLNHANIAAIYGFEGSGVVPAFVMELVEGDTLADRLMRGAIPLEETLPIARQIVEALEAAHEHGVIHRDLKPANIKVRGDGTVKVLDFGLAKTVAAAAGLDAAATHSLHATQGATILGTAAYMAPEQARGRPLDKRVDIWAFGCVLYELMTGHRAFKGDDLASTLAAVLQSEPEWSAVTADVPPDLRRLLARCLEKDPKERLRDIGEARIAIDRVLNGDVGVSESTAMLRAGPRWRRFAVPTIALLAGAAVTAAFLSFADRSTVVAPRATRFVITDENISGVGRDVAITPDGSRIVYVGENGTTLFVRALDQLEPIAVVRGGAPRDPFVSPDGQWVGFFDGGLTLKKVPISGGPAIVLARLGSFERGATWLDDNTIIFATQAITDGLQRVSAGGGMPAVLTRPDRAQGELGHYWPEVVPGGQTVLYTVTATTGGLDAAAIAAFNVANQWSTILLRGGSDARYVSSGHLAYAIGGSLHAVGFDSTRMTIVGRPSRVLPQIRTTAFGAVAMAIARDGTFVYASGGAGSGAERTLVWVDRQGRETPVAAPAGAYYFPRVSPDGSHIAANAVVEQDSDIWIWDLGRATLTRVTSDPAVDAWFTWMRDSQRVVFSSNRAGAFNLFRQAVHGVGSVERLAETANLQMPSDVSPDGTQVLFSETTAATGDDLMALRLDDPHDVRPVVRTAFDERNGIVSPDGHWLAYESNDTGTFEIYVRPFPDIARGRWQISTRGGTQPLWAPSGRELFYFAPDGTLMRVDVIGTPAWRAGVPAKLLEARYVRSTGGNVPRNYDITPDGRQFLLLKPRSSDAAGAPPQIVVVEHFNAELKRLVPRN